MKKLFFALVAVLFATSVVAQTGLTCNDPIPVDENYEGTVDGPCTLWYTASTYDLPLNVHFIPNNVNSEEGPKVEIDFTCTPGVYADKKLDSLINLVDAYDVTFPLTMYCDYVEKNGKVEWDLSVNKSYREQLAEFGIPYNVQTFIKVTYYESGRITLKPDELFRNCMENSEYVNLGDTIDVVANDADRVFVFPYVDWQNDSIRFVWIGDQSATIYEAVQECEFIPSTTNPYVRTSYTVSSEAPKKMYSDEMKVAIKDNIGAGLFYAKVISGVSGRLVIEKIPMPAAQGGAILLEYGKTVEVVDSNQLFCFPRTWGATQLQSVTDFGITMYVSNTDDFATVLNSFVATAEDNKRSVYLSNKEIGDLTSKSQDGYIYVRFRCASVVSITPDVWNTSDCAADSYLIRPNEVFSIKANDQFKLYRLRYEDFAGYDLKIKWSSYGEVTPYIADTCQFTFNSGDSHLVLTPKKIRRNATSTIKAEDLSLCASRVDVEGYFYVRFYQATLDGKITFQTEKPVSADPEIITNPCIANSIELKAGDQITLNLDSAFTIYRINYAEWVKQDRRLAWSGSESLHTFMAETCQFAVAPYNKYVVNYFVVPSDGEYLLDVATLKQFADKVDEDGYLYIRFLTEKPGTLTVE